MTALGLALFAPVALGWAPVAYVAVAITVFMAAYSIGSTLVSMINMDYARAESPGTDYTTMSAFAMLVAFAAGAIALQVAAIAGYLTVVVGAVALYALGTALVVWHQRRHDSAGLNRDAGREAAAPVQ